MSRAFVKEDDQEEAPFIPARSPLPEGETNYVTPAGKQALLDEKAALEKDKSEVKSVEKEQDRRRNMATINGKLKLLEQRINSARILDPQDQPKDTVRFGAIVKFKMNGRAQSFQIVGVDEADVKKEKIAFTSPIAKALIGMKIGETNDFQLGKEKRSIEVLEIDYR
ncbi:GreA/GreB family elongation factor [Marivirga sp.]|uniref:GreA/GreB family elongation factor n=1 Tax=Marivirga sp. TaxID=2018662 RepID=UPI002D803010|nr:GreA/GreB family elongation factor [Marivirga sp.]HET8859613.1 GreA/GreB family elongation factor [Marivirga sp.]